MTILTCNDISLSFGAVNVLDGISFSLNEGDRLGIVGVNGAGKSSLMRIITREAEATAGQVFLAKDRTVGMLAQNAAPDSDASLAEEAYRAFPALLAEEAHLKELEAASARSPADAERYAEAIDRFTRSGGYEFRGRCVGVLKNLGFSEEELSRPVSSLSGGQKTRLVLACLLLRDPDVLILDEPTNHLDTDALFWLENRLRISRKTLLVISHDRYFLDAVTSRTLEIEYGHGRMYDGGYSAYAEKKAVDREIQEHHYKSQQKEIARIEAYIAQQRRWNREKNIIAAESREKQLAKMERVERPDALPENIRLTFTSSGESGEDVMMLRRLKKGFPGKPPLFEGLSRTVHKRERVFLLGANGCGKSTLIKCMAGLLSPDAGEVELGSEVRVGYYDQENQQLSPGNTVLDEVWNDYPDLTLTEVRSALALFLFRGEDVEKRVAELSGGEKARLTLTKLILKKINLLILDEPTNHLDIGSREALEDALLSFDGTIVAVSHDRYFIRKLATRIWQFLPDTAVPEDFLGNYDDFLAYRAKNQAEERQDAAPVVTKAKEDFAASKQALAQQRKAEKRKKELASLIADTEARITAIDEEMNGSAACDAARLMELGSEKDALEEALLGYYEEQMG